ncbi:MULTISPECIES: hypothetical protein [Pseudoalteromonas]|jgi:hypothetical protein|uniref:hypothetical protein n=1 Tax=Pseudoalteromonas TaxID=53246 RepID=UPI00044D7776|nr:MULTISPECIES: hypothetical protein [Pseudoalteromonas]EWH04042.1 hypothetical protein AT00_21710 [Pseudoalteromonas lipolytica SCSIO 04301]QLJ08575.1 hypothetical protein GZH31_01520 [Pseudoalteromonas sp. JSTW]|tara:strand:+ start:2316 stop:2519 length:204 start_codon:yes stop_codon:yes gene_type:complete
MDFSALNKKTSDSFAKQRNMLKKLAKGHTMHCETCKGVLTLNLQTEQPGKGIVRCAKGCTDIVLELA